MLLNAHTIPAALPCLSYQQQLLSDQVALFAQRRHLRSHSHRLRGPLKGTVQQRRQGPQRPSLPQRPSPVLSLRRHPAQDSQQPIFLGYGLYLSKRGQPQPIALLCPGSPEQRRRER